MRITFFILISGLFFSLNGFTQGRDSIIYVTPESVNQKIVEYLKTSTRPGLVYAIFHNHSDTTSILVTTYGKEFTALADLIKNSNRYIKVSDALAIPVLLNEDISMSRTLRTVKNKGSKYESMQTTLVLASGFWVEYKGLYYNVSITKAEYYQN
ncbi:hypothetical protein ACFQZS_19135 [Mucilaginibacter calamicampi]|uniref:Uncharacterized protein n=1 Tax=Mucilaginibacter calamicampi TaxID=1302352 RepID=A0ABW2Z3E9_9SPHI